MENTLVNERIFSIQNAGLSFKKNSYNPFFKSKYLSLDDLMGELQPKLKELKLVIIHECTNGSLITKLVCIDNESSVISTFPINASAKPQEIGSSITYAKRYNISAIFNITCDEDDDGKKASATTPKVENPLYDLSKLTADLQKCTKATDIRELYNKVFKDHSEAFKNKGFNDQFTERALELK